LFKLVYNLYFGLLIVMGFCTRKSSKIFYQLIGRGSLKLQWPIYRLICRPLFVRVYDYSNDSFSFLKCKNHMKNFAVSEGPITDGNLRVIGIVIMTNRERMKERVGLPGGKTIKVKNN